MPQTNRIFIGVPVIPETHKQLDNWLSLRHQLCTAHKVEVPDKERQISSDSRHLTLHFLGDLTAEQRQLLHQNLVQYVNGLPAFNLQLNQLRHFPDAKSPILAATCEFTPELQKLHRETVNAIEQTGLSHLLSPTKYRPHITLIRAKGKASRQESDLLKSLKLPNIQLPVKAVVLYQSNLTSQGSIYKQLKTYKLQ